MHDFQLVACEWEEPMMLLFLIIWFIVVLQYRGCFDVGQSDVTDDEDTVSPTVGDENQSDIEQHAATKSSLKSEDQLDQNDNELLEHKKSLPRPTTISPKKYSSGSLLPDKMFSSKKFVGDFER